MGALLGFELLKRLPLSLRMIFMALTLALAFTVASGVAAVLAFAVGGLAGGAAVTVDEGAAGGAVFLRWQANAAHTTRESRKVNVLENSGIWSGPPLLV